MKRPRGVCAQMYGNGEVTWYYLDKPFLGVLFFTPVGSICFKLVAFKDYNTCVILDDLLNYNNIECDGKL